MTNNAEMSRRRSRVSRLDRDGRDTVIALDAVDSGSVAGLAPDAVLAVRLDRTMSRDARLAAGTRRFVQANRYHFLVPVVGPVILGTLAGLAYVHRRRSRIFTSRTTRGPHPSKKEDSVMHPASHTMPPALLLALALGLVAHGDATAHERRPLAPIGPGASPCPALAEVETAVGYPVRARPVAGHICMYELTGQYQGVFVTLMYQPATRAEDVYADIRRRVKVKGVSAQPDRLSLGDGGWGYSSRGKKEAAAVSQGQLYHVEMDYNLFDTMKVREDAAVRVIELAMRTAPAGPQAASSTAGNVARSFDACTLATNAEVGQIAEEEPEFVKFWDAPTAAYGGWHCDYGNGSIRVYEGKATAAALESTLKAFKADQQPRTPVSGIGDKAFFMIPKPDDKYNRIGLLAVYAGPRVLQLTLDAQGDEPITATRPRLERLAKLVLPRLR